MNPNTLAKPTGQTKFHYYGGGDAFSCGLSTEGVGFDTQFSEPAAIEENDVCVRCYAKLEHALGSATPPDEPTMELGE